LKLTRTKLWFALAVASALAVVVAVGFYIRSDAFRILYHTNRMNEALDAHYETPEEFGGMVGHVYGVDFERFEHHRDALVEIGVISHIFQRLDNIKADTPEYKHLSRTLVNCLKDGSPVPKFVGEFTWDDKSGVMKVEVWCYSKHESQWATFLDRRNVNDYESTFMDGNQIY